MKNKKRHAWRLLAAVAALLFIGGCSDGELASNVSPNLTPPSPMIISFYAEPAAISADQQTTISWEVAGADEVEITAVAATGEAVAFGVSTDQLSGSESVTLASTTDFILTATKGAVSYEAEDEGESEGDAELEKGGQIQFGPEEEEIEEPEAAESPLPVASSVSQTITVTVTPAGELIASITADKASVAMGESTVIRWNVTPSDDLIAVGVVADSGELIAPTDQCEGDMATILAQPALDAFPAVGCAVVTPDVATNYTINAQNSAGIDATASTMVSVSDTDVNAKIYAAKDEQATPQDNTLEVESWQNPVVVSWSVTPANAEVTVTAEGSVEASTSAPCELPSGATDKAEGSTKCKLVGGTTFTVTATYAGNTDSDDVVVNMKQSGKAGLVIANAWAFDGETVNIEMRLDTDAMVNPSVVENVLVAGQTLKSSDASVTTEQLLTKLKSGEPIVVSTVANAKLGIPMIKVELVYNGAEKAGYDPVQIVDLEASPPATDVVEVTSMAVFKSGDEISRYTGVMLDGYNDGKARMYKDGHEVGPDIPFANLINDQLEKQFGYKLDEGFFEDKIKDFPVTVAVKGSDPDDIFAGVTGGVMRYRQDSEGEYGWEVILINRRLGKGNIPKEHPTCGRDNETGTQKTQMGRKPSFDGDIVSLNRICDMALFGQQLLVATDYGMKVETNIHDEATVWRGTPSPELTAEQIVDLEFLTYAHVVNDLQVAGNRVYAATDDGVLVSEDGVHWQNTGFYAVATSMSGVLREGQNPVWALAYDARNEILYGGYEGGIKYLDTTAAEDAEDVVDCTDPDVAPGDCGHGWKDVDGIDQPVISLAVDPAAPSTAVAIFAGTPDGLMVTRNRGIFWSDVTIKGGAQAVTALAVAAIDIGPSIQYEIALGTAIGNELFRTTYVSKGNLRRRASTSNRD